MRYLNPLIPEYAFRTFNQTKSEYKNRIASNIIEDKEHVEISYYLAGFKREDINIKLEKNELTVSAKREKPETDATWIQREIRFGDFERTYALSEELDKESINAKFENGVLTISIAKKAEVTATSIEIN